MDETLFYFTNKGYRILKLLKQAKYVIVILAEYKNTKVIIKINKKYKTQQTEIQALKYFEKNNINNVPKLIDFGYFKYKNEKYEYLIETFIRGKLLYMYKNYRNNNFWNDVIIQIIIFCKFLEDNNILHNDLHDGNIIIKGHKVYFIDFEYMHDYKTKKIKSVNIENLPDNDKLRRSLGWSKSFHTGGDLNQILGYLVYDYPIPLKIKNHLKKYIFTKFNQRFPFCTLKSNDILLSKALELIQ